MSKRKRICRYSLYLVLPVLLAACSSTGNNVDTRFYLLSQLPATTAPLSSAPTQPPLAVTLTPVQLPQYLERPQIVIRVAPNRLELSEFDNWGGSLEKNMTRVLAAILSLLLASPDIQIASTRRSVNRDAHVELQVMQFERSPDGRTVLNTQWRLFGPDRDQPPKITQISRFVSDSIPDATPASDPDRTAVVAAMSQLLGELSQTIARAILRTNGS